MTKLKRLEKTRSMWPGFLLGVFSRIDILKTMKAEFIEDLKFVKRDILPNKLPGKSVLRNSVAPFLRKWMCDNGLREVDNSLGKSVTVSVPIDRAILEYCRKGHAIFWHSIVPLGELSIGGAAPIDHDKNPVPLITRGEKKIILNQFFKQKVGFSKVAGLPAKECFVKRDDAVRYFCNQRGGSHTHQQRNLTRIKPVIESMETRIGIDLETRSVLFEDGLSKIDIRDESKLVYTFLHAITYDTFVKLEEALRYAKFITD